MNNEQTKIAIIMEKLETMHDSLRQIEKETKATNGKVALNVKEIALINQESQTYLKKIDLGKSLWSYLTGLLVILGFFGFIFAGWFENKINKTLRESLADDISFAVAEELKGYEFNLVE